MVTTCGRGQYRGGEKRVIMGLYEVTCVKLLEIVKHCKIFKIFHSIKNYLQYKYFKTYREVSQNCDFDIESNQVSVVYT